MSDHSSHGIGQSAADIQKSSNKVFLILVAVVAAYLVIWAAGILPDTHHEATPESVVEATVNSPELAEPASHGQDTYVPPLWAVLPFVMILLAIAVLPLISFTEHWWESNRNRFIVAATLALITLIYYGVIHPGGVPNHMVHGHTSTAGLSTVGYVFSNAILNEYIPFIALLFSLFVISGGINLRGDLPAHPLVNCAFIATGGVLASFIGTTGAAMVLIRPLLSTNAERKNKVHTIIFFIFVVCNCGGLLLPIGDPPLFLGYLRGVPFTWTLHLWPYWLGVNAALLLIYFAWDRVMYSKEDLASIVKDEAMVQPLRLSGRFNFVLLLGVVLCVALIVPGEELFGTGFIVPHFLRESLMMLLVMASLKMTQAKTRLLNKFDYHAIIEVAALFFGIFICMQVPIEILHAEGSKLGIDSGRSFFWATGFLSSFLDNAPTYVVFFETAIGLPVHSDAAMVALTSGRLIPEGFLIAISLGAVLMGANTYIGNGPNFMVKSIAEQAGIKMPSFFGYMLYSIGILIPVFLVVSFLI